MRPSSRLLPIALLLAVPGVAWAEGNAVVLPMVANGVDSKVSNNLTSLLSSELDFSGAFDTVNDIPAPASLNASCLTSTKCLAGIAKDNDANAVVAGSVSTGSAGLKVSLVLYDAGKNAIVRKKSYDIASDVASVAGAAPKMAKELMGEGGGAAAEAEAGASEAAFADDEDFAFDKSSDVKGKTKFTPETKKGKLVDTADEEDDAAAEAAAEAAAAKRRAEAEAKMKAEARARAEAEAVARAEAEKAAKARAEAEAKAKAKADAEAKAKAEAVARARAEAEAEAEAEERAVAKASASRKSAPAEEPTEEDLEAELAAFSFGGGGKVAADAEPEEEEPAPKSFSERYSSTSSSKTTKPTESKSSTKTTASRARVEEVEEEEEPDQDLAEAEEEAPRASSRSSSSRTVAEELDEEEEVVPARRSSREEDEEDLDSDSRSRSSSSASRRTVDEEEEDTPSRSRSRLSEEEEPVRRAGNDGARARFGVAARGGYARYGSLDFVTYGAELDIPVASRVLLLLGVEGASTNRNYTDEERAVIASSAGILPEQVQDWNAILPINVGVVYKVPTTAIQPYIGLDGLAVAYTATPDFAFGARLRGGCDFMVSENFGFNLDVGLGVLSGEQFDLIQAGLADTGFYPEVSGGTVLSF